jgi:hypothetical protein
MSRHTTAHYFLEALVDLGVDYIFANLGTDHVSLIEEMARWDKEGRKYPQMILCPHEVVAVHMAGGYALATGRGQAVLVHVDAGTANACMAIQDLFRYRLPVMLFAGRAPHTLHGELPGSRDAYVHFVQDPFDIASIVRPYVKWEYSLPSGVVVKEALARARAFAQSDPPGPVYMMLPRETLAEEWDDADMPAYPSARYGSVHSGGIEPARVDAIAQALMADAGRVQQQILDRDGPARRHQIEHRPASIVFSLEADLHAGKGWNVFADGIVERDLAAIDQHHDSYAGNGLGDRVNREDGVGRHRRSRLGVTLAEAFEVHRPAVALNQDDRAGNSIGRDFAIDEILNRRELVDRKGSSRRRPKRDGGGRQRGRDQHGGGDCGKPHA